MYIIPYLHKQVEKHGRIIHVIDMLTEGGQRLWTEADTVNIDTDVLEPNGLLAKEMETLGPHHYVSLDSSTDLTSMYTWSECPYDSDMLCWRTFYIIMNQNDEPWIQIPDIVFKPAIEQILLSLRHRLSK